MPPQSHIEAFEQALNADELYDLDALDTPSTGSSIIHVASGSPQGTRAPGTPANGSALHLSTMSGGNALHGSVSSASAPHLGSQRIRKVSALSDFAPVNLRVVKRRHGRGRRDVERRQEWLYILVRWPLLVSLSGLCLLIVNAVLL